MPNMSYCRMRNTLRDFRDCVRALQDGEELSSDEAKAALSLIEEAKEIADMTKDDLNIDSDFDDEEED